METAPLTLSSSLSLLQTSTGHKPTIIINHRKNTITFHQPTSLFPSGHLQVMCGHKCGHVVKAVGINGGDEDDGLKKTRGAVRATVVLACVIGAMCFTRPMCRPALAIWPFSTQLPESTDSMRVPGTLAGLLEARRPKNQWEVDKAKRDFYEVLNKPLIECPDLKAAGRLIVLSGDEEAGEVVKKLHAVYEQHKLFQKPGAYELGLALVEMLIFQKKYVDAETLVTKLEPTLPGNHDPKLYKALISIMRGQTDEEMLWDSYVKAVGDMGDVPTTFPEFKAQMLKLKRK